MLRLPARAVALAAFAVSAFAPACISPLGHTDSTDVSRTAERECSNELSAGRSYSIHSAILGETRQYWAHVPKSYATTPSKKYPVLYLLDGDTFFLPAVGVVHAMSAGGSNNNYQIPELIVVGVVSPNRELDYTPTHVNDWDPSGGSEKFLAFIEKELVPKLDADYRTAPYRILAGHSLGGLLAINALLTSPPIFNSYIAMDPSLWWDNKLAHKRLDELGTSLRLLPLTAVFISAHAGAQRLSEYAEFSERLRSNRNDGFRAGFRVLEGEDHGSMPLLSLYYGLRYIFDGYKPASLGGLADNPAAINAHFNAVSQKLGFQYLPPEDFVHELCRHAPTEQAFACWTVNVANYPHSFAGHNDLGAAYQARGERGFAIEQYQKSLALKPNNEGAMHGLKELAAVGR